MRHLATETHRAQQSDVRARRKLFQGIIAQAARDLVRMKSAREKVAILEANPTGTKSEIQKMAALKEDIPEGMDALEFFKDWRLTAFSRLADVNANAIRANVDRVARDGLTDDLGAAEESDKTRDQETS